MGGEWMARFVGGWGINRLLPGLLSPWQNLQSLAQGAPPPVSADCQLWNSGTMYCQGTLNGSQADLACIQEPEIVDCKSCSRPVSTGSKMVSVLVWGRNFDREH